jgi:hypothetical protein
MSVLRAILGRFARFLVRIARTLDPALTTAPYWVMPERMAALRQRYPGAPERWLELIARRTAIGEAADPRVLPSEPPIRRADEGRPSIEAHPPNFRSRPRETLRNLLRLRGRPAVGFPQPEPRSRARPSEARIAARADSSPQAPPLPATRAAVRPGLTFITGSVRNPIANLLRIERPTRRPAMIHFHADDPAARADRQAPEHDDFVRHEHQTYFPDLAGRETYRPPMVGAVDPRRAVIQSETRWPARAERPSVDSNWPNERQRSVRPDPSFAAHDPRWPELPPLAVEYGPSPTPSLDEAILLAEQIGGTWSG